MKKTLKRASYSILMVAMLVVFALSLVLTLSEKVTHPTYAEGTTKSSGAVVTVEAPDSVVKNDKEFTVNISMNNTSGNSVFALDFELGFDNNTFEFVEGSIDKALFPTSLDITEKEGGLKIAPEASPANPVTEVKYNFVTLKFKAKSTAAAGNYTFAIGNLAVATMDLPSLEIPSSVVNKTVKIEEPSELAELTSLKVKSNGADVLLTQSGTAYTVTNPVPYSAAVSVIANVSAKASVKIGGSAAVSGQAKTISLSVGVNTVAVEVIAENGTAKSTYNIKITRSEGNASTAITTLKVLDAKEADLEVAVSGDTYTVSSKVPYADRLSIKVNVTVASTSVVTIGGKEAVSGLAITLALSGGENKVPIIVTSETNSRKTYMLIINVEEPKTEYGLASIDVKSGNTPFELSPVFSSDVYTYVLRIPETTETLNVTATTNDTSAEVVSGVGDYTKDEIKAGNILTITVRAQSGETKNYQLVVVHMSDIVEGLSELKVNGSKINLVAGVYTYDITVSKDVDKIDLDFITKFDEKVETLGNTQLVEGNNTVILKVQLKDGSYQFYTINVLKEVNKNDTLFYITIGAAIVLLIVLLLILIAFMRVKKKSDKMPEGGIHVNVSIPENSTHETTPQKEEPNETEQAEEVIKEEIVEEPSQEEPKEADQAEEVIKEEIAEEPSQEEPNGADQAEEPEKEDTEQKSETQKVRNKPVSLTDAYEELAREQKSFFDNLKKYALAKPNASISTAKYHETIKIRKMPILKLQIKRSVTVAAFLLENEQLKEFRMQEARSKGTHIKVKASEIAIYNLESYNTAVGMIDLMVKQSEDQLEMQ